MAQQEEKHMLARPGVTPHLVVVVRVHTVLGITTELVPVEWWSTKTLVHVVWVHPPELKFGGDSAHQGEQLNFDKQYDMKKKRHSRLVAKGF